MFATPPAENIQALQTSVSTESSSQTPLHIPTASSSLPFSAPPDALLHINTTNDNRAHVLDNSPDSPIVILSELERGLDVVVAAADSPSRRFSLTPAIQNGLQLSILENCEKRGFEISTTTTTTAGIATAGVAVADGHRFSRGHYQDEFDGVVPRSSKENTSLVPKENHALGVNTEDVEEETFYYNKNTTDRGGILASISAAKYAAATPTGDLSCSSSSSSSRIGEENPKSDSNTNTSSGFVQLPRVTSEESIRTLHSQGEGTRTQGGCGGGVRFSLFSVEGEVGEQDGRGGTAGVGTGTGSRSTHDALSIRDSDTPFGTSPGLTHPLNAALRESTWKSSNKANFLQPQHSSNSHNDKCTTPSSLSGMAHHPSTAESRLDVGEGGTTSSTSHTLTRSPQHGGGGGGGQRIRGLRRFSVVGSSPQYNPTCTATTSASNQSCGAVSAAGAAYEFMQMPALLGVEARDHYRSSTEELSNDRRRSPRDSHHSRLFPTNHDSDGGRGIGATATTINSGPRDIEGCGGSSYFMMSAVSPTNGALINSLACTAGGGGEGEGEGGMGTSGAPTLVSDSTPVHDGTYPKGSSTAGGVFDVFAREGGKETSGRVDSSVLVGPIPVSVALRNSFVLGLGLSQGFGAMLCSNTDEGDESGSTAAFGFSRLKKRGGGGGTSRASTSALMHSNIVGDDSTCSQQSDGIFMAGEVGGSGIVSPQAKSQVATAPPESPSEPLIAFSRPRGPPIRVSARLSDGDLSTDVEEEDVHVDDRDFRKSNNSGRIDHPELHGQSTDALNGGALLGSAATIQSRPAPISDASRLLHVHVVNDSADIASGSSGGQAVGLAGIESTMWDRGVANSASTNTGLLERVSVTTCTPTPFYSFAPSQHTGVTTAIQTLQSHSGVGSISPSHIPNGAHHSAPAHASLAQCLSLASGTMGPESVESSSTSIGGGMCAFRSRQVRTNSNSGTNAHISLTSRSCTHAVQQSSSSSNADRIVQYTSDSPLTPRAGHYSSMGLPLPAVPGPQRNYHYHTYVPQPQRLAASSASVPTRSEFVAVRSAASDGQRPRHAQPATQFFSLLRGRQGDGGTNACTSEGTSYPKHHSEELTPTCTELPATNHFGGRLFRIDKKVRKERAKRFSVENERRQSQSDASLAGDPVWSSRRKRVSEEKPEFVSFLRKTSDAIDQTGGPLAPPTSNGTVSDRPDEGPCGARRRHSPRASASVSTGSYANTFGNSVTTALHEDVQHRLRSIPRPLDAASFSAHDESDPSESRGASPRARGGAGHLANLFSLRAASTTANESRTGTITADHQGHRGHSPFLSVIQVISGVSTPYFPPYGSYEDHQTERAHRSDAGGIGELGEADLQNPAGGHRRSLTPLPDGATALSENDVVVSLAGGQVVTRREAGSQSLPSRPASEAHTVAQCGRNSTSSSTPFGIAAVRALRSERGSSLPPQSSTLSDRREPDDHFRAGFTIASSNADVGTNHTDESTSPKPFFHPTPDDPFGIVDNNEEGEGHRAPGGLGLLLPSINAICSAAVGTSLATVLLSEALTPKSQTLAATCARERSNHNLEEIFGEENRGDGEQGKKPIGHVSSSEGVGGVSSQTVALHTSNSVARECSISKSDASGRSLMGLGAEAVASAATFVEDNHPLTLEDEERGIRQQQPAHEHTAPQSEHFREVTTNSTVSSKPLSHPPLSRIQRAVSYVSAEAVAPSGSQPSIVGVGGGQGTPVGEVVSVASVATWELGPSARRYVQYSPNPKQAASTAEGSLASASSGVGGGHTCTGRLINVIPSCELATLASDADESVENAHHPRSAGQGMITIQLQSLPSAANIVSGENNFQEIVPCAGSAVEVFGSFDGYVAGPGVPELSGLQLPLSLIPSSKPQHKGRRQISSVNDAAASDGLTGLPPAGKASVSATSQSPDRDPSMILGPYTPLPLGLSSIYELTNSSKGHANINNVPRTRQNEAEANASATDVDYNTNEATDKRLSPQHEALVGGGGHIFGATVSTRNALRERDVGAESQSIQQKQAEVNPLHLLSQGGVGSSQNADVCPNDADSPIGPSGGLNSTSRGRVGGVQNSVATSVHGHSSPLLVLSPYTCSTVNTASSSGRGGEGNIPLDSSHPCSATMNSLLTSASNGPIGGGGGSSTSYYYFEDGGVGSPRTRLLGAAYSAVGGNIGHLGIPSSSGAIPPVNLPYLLVPLPHRQNASNSPLPPANVRSLSGATATGAVR